MIVLGHLSNDQPFLDQPFLSKSEHRRQPETVSMAVSFTGRHLDFRLPEPPRPTPEEVKQKRERQILLQKQLQLKFPYSFAAGRGPYRNAYFTEGNDKALAKVEEDSIKTPKSSAKTSKTSSVVDDDDEIEIEDDDEEEEEEAPQALPELYTRMKLPKPKVQLERPLVMAGVRHPLAPPPLYPTDNRREVPDISDPRDAHRDARKSGAWYGLMPPNLYQDPDKLLDDVGDAIDALYAIDESEVPEAQPPKLMPDPEPVAKKRRSNSAPKILQDEPIVMPTELADTLAAVGGDEEPFQNTRLQQLLKMTMQTPPTVKAKPRGRVQAARKKTGHGVFGEEELARPEPSDDYETMSFAMGIGPRPENVNEDLVKKYTDRWLQHTGWDRPIEWIPADVKKQAAGIAFQRRKDDDYDTFSGGNKFVDFFKKVGKFLLKTFVPAPLQKMLGGGIPLNILHAVATNAPLSTIDTKFKHFTDAERTAMKAAIIKLRSYNGHLAVPVSYEREYQVPKTGSGHNKSKVMFLHTFPAKDYSKPWRQPKTPPLVPMKLSKKFTHFFDSFPSSKLGSGRLLESPDEGLTRQLKHILRPVYLNRRISDGELAKRMSCAAEMALYCPYWGRTSRHVLKLLPTLCGGSGMRRQTTVDKLREAFKDLFKGPGNKKALQHLKENGVDVKSGGSVWGMVSYKGKCYDWQGYRVKCNKDVVASEPAGKMVPVQSGSGFKEFLGDAMMGIMGVTHAHDKQARDAVTKYFADKDEKKKGKMVPMGKGLPLGAYRIDTPKRWREFRHNVILSRGENLFDKTYESYKTGTDAYVGNGDVRDVTDAFIHNAEDVSKKISTLAGLSPPDLLQDIHTIPASISEAFANDPVDTLTTLHVATQPQVLKFVPPPNSTELLLDTKGSLAVNRVARKEGKEGKGGTINGNFSDSWKKAKEETRKTVGSAVYKRFFGDGLEGDGKKWRLPEQSELSRTWDRLTGWGFTNILGHGHGIELSHFVNGRRVMPENNRYHPGFGFKPVLKGEGCGDRAPKQPKKMQGLALGRAFQVSRGPLFAAATKERAWKRRVGEGLLKTKMNAHGHDRMFTDNVEVADDDEPVRPIGTGVVRRKRAKGRKKYTKKTVPTTLQKKKILATVFAKYFNHKYDGDGSDFPLLHVLKMKNSKQQMINYFLDNNVGGEKFKRMVVDISSKKHKPLSFVQYRKLPASCMYL